MQAHFERAYPKAPAGFRRRPPRAIRAKALDTLRGLLPAATQSNVGIFGTGQAFEALLLRMRAHPLAEVRACADAMLVELRKVIPAFLTRVDQPDRGGRWSEYLAETREALDDVAARPRRRRAGAARRSHADRLRSGRRGQGGRRRALRRSDCPTTSSWRSRAHVGRRTRRACFAPTSASAANRRHKPGPRL